MTNVNVNEDVIQQAARSAAQEAVRQYQLEQIAAEDAAQPAVYGLNIQQAAQYLQDNPDAQIFEQNGSFYTQADEGVYYEIPQQVLNYNVIGMFKAGRRGLSMEGAHLSHLGKAAHMAGSGVRHATEAATSSGQFLKGAGKGLVGIAGPGATAAEAAGYRHKWKVAGGAGAALAAAGGAGYLASQRREGEGRYQIDENTGVVYFDGYAIGEIKQYNDTSGTDVVPVAPEGDPQLVVSEAATSPEAREDGALMSDPGDPTSNFLIPLNRGDSDQYALGAEAIQYVAGENQAQNAEIYQLRQEIDRLNYANDLLQVSKKGESYKAYLLDLKKAGAPIGDIDSTVNFMLTQNDEQVKHFKQMLETAPKINLGPLTTYEIPAANESKAKAEYAAHREQYGKLGVEESDLQYAQYVRVNSFTNEATNGKPQF